MSLMCILGWLGFWAVLGFNSEHISISLYSLLICFIVDCFTTFPINVAEHD